MCAKVCNESEMLNLPAGSEPKRTEPKLEQPYYWTMPSKLYILGSGPRWILVAASGISKSGFV